MCRKYSPTRLAMKVLAIDPGYDRLGIAVVQGDPSRPTLLWSDCILPPSGQREDRLAFIAEAITAAIRAHEPELFAIEKLFFSINKKTALGVAEARGVALAAAGSASLPVVECSPQQVKLAVTGHGGATKRDVAIMIPRLLTLPDKKRLDDEIDAIAIGITGLAMGAVKR